MLIHGCIQSSEFFEYSSLPSRCFLTESVAVWPVSYDISSFHKLMVRNFFKGEMCSRLHEVIPIHQVASLDLAEVCAPQSLLVIIIIIIIFVLLLLFLIPPVVKIPGVKNKKSYKHSWSGTSPIRWGPKRYPWMLLNCNAGPPVRLVERGAWFHASFPIHLSVCTPAWWWWWWWLLLLL